MAGGPLRQSTELPEKPDAVYHEAQVSFLLFGPDEWFWTVYCIVDTYFGSEISNEEYLEAVSGPPEYAPFPQDPPTGGEKLLNEPVWNPRGYFLVVLARRMEQVSKEWSDLVAAINDRLTAYVSKIHNRIPYSRLKAARSRAITET